MQTLASGISVEWIGVLSAALGVVAAILNRKRIVEFRHVVALPAADTERQRKIDAAHKQFGQAMAIIISIFAVTYLAKIAAWIGLVDGYLGYLVVTIPDMFALVMGLIGGVSLLFQSFMISVYRKSIRPAAWSGAILLLAIGHAWIFGPVMLQKIGLGASDYEQIRGQAYSVVVRDNQSASAYARAHSLAIDAFNLNPASPDVGLTYAFSLFRQGDYDTAERVRQQVSILEDEPEWRLLGDLIWLRTRADDVVPEELQRMLARSTIDDIERELAEGGSISRERAKTIRGLIAEAEALIESSEASDG